MSRGREGGFTAFFSDPALIALAIAPFVMPGVAVFSRGNLSPGGRQDRANGWAIVVFALFRLLEAYTDRKGVWTIDGNTIAWLGIILVVADGALRMWRGFALGCRFSGLIAIQPGHRLVTSSVYGVIRKATSMEVVGRLQRKVRRLVETYMRCQSSCRDPELTDCIRVCPSCDPLSAECNALLQLATKPAD